MNNIDNNSGSENPPKQENPVIETGKINNDNQQTANVNQLTIDNSQLTIKGGLQGEAAVNSLETHSKPAVQNETKNKPALNLKPLKDTYKKYDIKHKDFPSQIFINQEFYKRFNVSKAKPEFNEINEISDLVEIAFKNKRRVLYANKNKLPFVNYQYVILEVENGLDIGTVTAFGKCAETKLKLFYKDKDPQYSVVRHAKLDDMHRYKHNLDNHSSVVEMAREQAEKLNLEMKITDAEWQFDQQRLTVYFTSPLRIDFRQLVKELAKAFKTRIELRQISTREDAKRIGGMGSCGRALCCASFAHENSHVTLDHARVQQLSNNVTKLSGYCGRLKCCLLYEYNTYLEILSKYPSMNAEIQFPEGKAKILKADIFKELVHAYIPESSTYKTISFQNFVELHGQGKVCKLHDYNHKNCEIRKMFLDPDEDDIEELKKLED
ncbi:MAG: regulatory iron-sulfur-containing complex subunit RicT [bacterium]